MAISRRDFLKYSGGTAVAGTLGGLAPTEAEARERENRIKGAAVTTTICPYCAVGCGMIVHTKNGKVINIEGDPDHPINRGTLCSKGASLYQIADNPTRLKKPLYRAPGAASWKEVEWDWVYQSPTLSSPLIIMARSGLKVNREMEQNFSSVFPGN